jgi:hypothetical protein
MFEGQADSRQTSHEVGHRVRGGARYPRLATKRVLSASEPTRQRATEIRFEETGICAAAYRFCKRDRAFPQSLTNQRLGAESVRGPRLHPSCGQEFVKFVVAAALKQARQADGCSDHMLEGLVIGPTALWFAHTRTGTTGGSLAGRPRFNRATRMPARRGRDWQAANDRRVMMRSCLRRRDRPREAVGQVPRVESNEPS